MKDRLLEESFAEFWKASIRKVGKEAAKKEYAKARKKVTHSELMEAWRLFNERHRQDGTATQYICHPRTWLSQGRWDDAESLAPEPQKGPVPYSKADEHQKRWWAEMLSKPYMKPHMLRLTPKNVEQLKAEGYLT